MTKETETHNARTNQPPIPKVAYLVINPLMKLLLRSPLHNLVSDDLLLITFTGRKSGRSFTTPVGYIEVNEDSLMIFTESPWWRNLAHIPEVTLRLRGKKVKGRAEIIEDPDRIRNYIQTMSQKRGKENLERMGFDVFGEQGQIDLEHQAVQDRKFIQIKLQENR